MEGDGMVAVVRGLREGGLAVTLLDGNRQYMILPNSTYPLPLATQPGSAQRTTPASNVSHASTQQCLPKLTVDISTEPSIPQNDRNAQAVDGRYTSMYKTMHCNVRPTSPPVLLTEFPPQRPDHYPGSVCSPQPSRAVDAFANSLRKYPKCLSPDRSSEVMERLVNYTQANKAVSRNCRKSPSPTRVTEPAAQNVLESKATFIRTSRSPSYEPDVTIRPKKIWHTPTRDTKKDDHYEKPVRGYDVRYVKDIAKRMREGVKAYSSYPYNHPVCPPTIKQNQDYHPLSYDYQNSTNSVNMEIQTAVKMLSKEVGTLSRGDITRKTVAVPESPITSAGEDYVEGEFYFVENLDIATSIKSIQTNFYPSDTTLKPRKSAQTVFSTIDFHSSRNRTVVSRKTKSHEEIKVTNEQLKMSLLELINEISDTVSKNTIRDELIKKLFLTDNNERNEHKWSREKNKHEKCHKYESSFCSAVYDYVEDYQELVGKLKNCYGDPKHVLRSEIKPFRLSEYRQLDFVLKDWVNQLNLKTSDIDRYMDRSELLNSVENRIKELLKNWTKEDFDLKSEIVDILKEIPIEVNKSYNMKSYLRKLVDVLLKKMRNVIVTQQTGRLKRSFSSRSRKILTEEDIRDFVRGHLLYFFNECSSRICEDTLHDLENELVDLVMDSIDCIWCMHDDVIMDEMDIILQDMGKITDKEASYISNIMLQDLQEILNNCVYNQAYTILNVSNNSGQYMNTTNNTDSSIGSITEEDLQANLDRYTNQLCLQINQWLDTLNIPRIKDSGFREVVVNDLAGDIVDRLKYVELNHTGRNSAQDQLEALKYQIFKWINKLVGDDNQETIDHAENLLQRINSVPVPMLVNPKHCNTGGPRSNMDNSISANAGQGSPKPQIAKNLNQSGQCRETNIYSSKSTPKSQGIQGQSGFLPFIDQTDHLGQGPQTANTYSPSQGQGCPNIGRESEQSFGPSSPNNPWGSNTFSSGFEPSLTGNPNQIRHENGSVGIYCPMDPNQSINDCFPGSSPSRSGGPVSVKKLNEDYDEYLKYWVKQIPIVGKTPAKEQAIETTRLGVYNGIWKGVTKMKLDPNIFSNQLYWQDAFEEEVERLLKDIPQSQELDAAKPTLKAQLLQKTLVINDLIKYSTAPASFKQQLIDNIENNLPERKLTENEGDNENDKLEKQDLVDYYILYTRYKHEDNIKATVHKNNFLKRLDEFLNKIKNRHGLVDMDTIAYANEVINSFEKVPTPNVPAIKDEADDILLAMEVENWISDIPQNPNTVGSLEKRRTRDAIVKKIQEIRTDVCCCDHAFRVPLKAELPKFLEKLPIQAGTNVDYMVDELANRIKNLSTSIHQVSFQEPQNYEEFSRNMPAASSLHDMSGERNSYLVIGGEIVNDSTSRRPVWVREQPPVPEEEIQWLSMEKTQMLSNMRSGSVVPQGIGSPQVYNPNASDYCAPATRSYLGEGNIPRDASPNITWKSDQAAVPYKRQRIAMEENQMPSNINNTSGHPKSMRSQLYNPNESLTARRYPGEGNIVTDAGPMRANWMYGQAPVTQEENQWLSMEETLLASQMRSGSVEPQAIRWPQLYRPNASEPVAVPRSCPGGAQASFGSSSPRPLSPTAQGQLPHNLQDGKICIGPPCCPNPLCQGLPGLKPYPQSVAHSPGLRGLYGQGSPNVQGSPCCNASKAGRTSSLPQGLSDQSNTNRNNQSFGPVFNPVQQNIQNSSVPGSQMQGAHISRPSPSPSNPYNKSQNFGPGEPAYNQIAPSSPGGQPYQGPHYKTVSNIGHGQGPVLNNNAQKFGPYDQASLGSKGQMPFQGTTGAQSDQVSQDHKCQPSSNLPSSPQQTDQASIYGVIEGSGHNYSNTHRNASAQAEASLHSPIFDQTSQSPGPVSAASQVPDQEPRPFHVQNLTRGRMRTHVRYHVPGSSTRSEGTPSSGAAAFWAQADGNDAIQTSACISNRENQPTHNKLGTNREIKLSIEPKYNELKPLDVHEKELHNFKSVQTAVSTIDITTTKCKYSDIRSKSQEELTKKTKKQGYFNRTDRISADLQHEMTEWFEVHSDNVKIKLWGEKMKRLAEKLKKPGGEEKLRSKIENYLMQAPEQYSEGDDANLEFRKQLPDNIIRKLKKMYLRPTEANVNTCKTEIPKYCSRFKVENFRKAVLNWTKTLNIKKKDFLGRNVKKDDVFKYVAEKLEPLILDRPKSDLEYKKALQSNVAEIVYELPLALSSHDKDFCLKKVTEDLINNIFMIENIFTSSYIQPTTNEIKEFVKDEITFFLEKCCVAISTKRMEYLETELIDLLLDLTDISDIDSHVADEVAKLFKEIGKLPEYRAKYFTNLLLKDYKEFFFRENFFRLRGNLDSGRPDVYSAFQNATNLVDFNAAKSFETYRQRLVEKINKWMTKLNIPIKDKNFIEVVVKGLASHIIDRYKYFLLNPSLKGTDVEELEQLKFQIFKWTNKLLGEENTSVLEHAQELMSEIHNIPKPSLQSTNAVQSISPLNIDKINNINTKPYIDVLTDQIYDWYCEVPNNLHMSQDTKLNKLLIKDLAGDIEKGFDKTENGLIDEEVGKWTEKVFDNKLDYRDLQQLKNRISSVPYSKDNRTNDLKHEKLLTRSCDDIIDEWLDTVPIAPKKQKLFTNNKNEIIHAIAVKIFKIKTKIKHLPDEVVEKKLQEELSHWMKKLPLHGEVDNQNDRDKYVAKLIKSIQIHYKNNSLESQAKVINDEPVFIQLEKVMLGWLKKTPLYRGKSPEEKGYQERTVKELAYKLNRMIGDDDADLDENIIERIRMLDPKQTEDSIKNTACQLKSHLQKLDPYRNLCKQHKRDDKFLLDTIEVWLKGLPLQVTDVSQFNKQKADFIKSVKQLISLGSNAAVMKKDILIFTKTLPMNRTKKNDLRYLNEEVLKLIQMLKKIKPMGDVPSLSRPKTRTKVISDAIKEWTSRLPMKPVYCPRELRSFIDDMCSVITFLLLNPVSNLTKCNDAKLHREISKFLRRLPLIYELSTESQIFRMAGELTKTLKNINLFRTENCTKLNKIAVYGVTVEHKNTTADSSIQSIKESDINENLEKYTKQIVQQIGEWFDRLNLPASHQEGFKEVIINDLAGDIVDRHKYLELNPNNTGTEEDELEHLKYQIFKWINKLVGEDNLETIGHAEELMKRINGIPVPMLVRPQDQARSHSSSQHQPSNQGNSSVGQQNNSQIVIGPIRKSGEPAVGFRDSPLPQQSTSNRMRSPNDLSSHNSKPCCSQKLPPSPPPSEEGTKKALYEKYVKIFRDQCNALPIDESTPYNAVLAEQARRAIYNAILKTFFNLKSDPDIENDYKYFEFILEERLDNFLDVLPQTEELKKMRQSWKVGILKYAIDMLDELHQLSDRPCFRRTVIDKFNRQFAIDNELQYCFLLQQGFLSSVADAYILQSNYKEKDPVKANIYKNRLMKEVDKLANHLSKEHNVGFRLFDKSYLVRITMKVLEQVPVPKDDVLQDEVEEIHLADEVEKWYNQLPTRPLLNEMDGVLRKRMMELLAQKLHDMHKRLSNEDPSKEEKMKHEMSQFLEKRAELQTDEDLNINFMVDELHNRLKNRWARIQEPAGFDEFEKAKPLSSTFAHVDNAEFLAPLMDAATSTSPEPGQRTPGDQGYFIQPGHSMQSIGQVGMSYGCAPRSPQTATIHSLDPNLSRQVPYGIIMSQGRSSAGYASQQRAPIQSLQAPASPRVIGDSQLGAKQSPIRMNLSQQDERPRQASVVRQSPQLIHSTAHNSPMIGRGALDTSKVKRLQYINQSLGPQAQCVDQNMANQTRGSAGSARSGGQQAQQFTPSHKGRSQRQFSCEVPRNASSRGKATPSQGVGTADVITSAGGAPISSEEDMLDGNFRVKCRCLEAYRRMRSLYCDD